MRHTNPYSGVGLGLRADFIDHLADQLPKDIDFLEIAPENYIGRGGFNVSCFEKLQAHYPFLTHGLSLSIGGLDELNWDYLKKLKAFLKTHNIPWFTDHLCMASAHGAQFHDLLPLPFTLEAAKHVSERARVVQDFIEVPLALENVSYYLSPGKPELSELEFIQEVLNRSGVALMLDVNNVYVNAINHGIDAKHYIRELARENILHLHIAGHDRESETFALDTHGTDVCPAVWDLLRLLGSLIPLPPVIIERDNNVPDFNILMREVNFAKEIVSESQQKLTKRAQ